MIADYFTTFKISRNENFWLTKVRIDLSLNVRGEVRYCENKVKTENIVYRFEGRVAVGGGGGPYFSSSAR